MQDIYVKIVIDGKEALARFKLTDEVLKSPGQSLRWANEESKKASRPLSLHLLIFVTRCKVEVCFKFNH